MRSLGQKSAFWLLSSSLVALAASAVQAADTTPPNQTPTTLSPAAPAPAAAGTTTDQTAPTPPPTAPSAWADTLKFNAQFDLGAIINPQNPGNGLNFGQLFTDRANQVVLNQALLSLQRPADPKATGYDFGFSLQALYGTDARFVQFLGEFNSTFASRYQLAIISANVQAHLPWLTPGGIDVKAGQYPTPLGFETIDPSTNPFYSHSYIFNFGLPFVHTGVLATWHATSEVDIWGGVDSGVNTTLGAGDNNAAAAGLFGVGLTLLDGKLSVLGLTHFGPENGTAGFQALSPTVNANGYYRWLNDITATYKPTDKWSFTTELNLIRDDYFQANGYGVAQYASYVLNDVVTLNARGEIYRDDHGFYVAGFRNPHDFVNLTYGYPAPGVVTAAPTTYSEITLGLTYKPSIPYVAAFMVRPEVRYDYALTNTRPFNSGADRGAFTFGTDVIVGF